MIVISFFCFDNVNKLICIFILFQSIILTFFFLENVTLAYAKTRAKKQIIFFDIRSLNDTDGDHLFFSFLPFFSHDDESTYYLMVLSSTICLDFSQ
jgi:hypothetical protein